MTLGRRSELLKVLAAPSRFLKVQKLVKLNHAGLGKCRCPVELWGLLRVRNIKPAEW